MIIGGQRFDQLLIINAVIYLVYYEYYTFVQIIFKGHARTTTKAHHLSKYCSPNRIYN